MLGKFESNIPMNPSGAERTPTFRPRKNSLRRPLGIKQSRDLKPVFLFTGLFVFLMTTLVLVTVFKPGSVPEMNRWDSTIS